MAKELIFIYIVMLVLLVSIVSAVNPHVGVIQVASGSTALDVEAPSITTIKQGYDGMVIHTHVFNGTTGEPLIPSKTSIGCYVHLYNISGEHTMIGEMSPDGVEWQIGVSKNNFTLTGEHSYIIYCNSSKSGGFVRGIFEVTPTGIVEDATNIHIVILLAVIFIIIVYLILTGKFAVEAFTEHALIKMLFLITSMWMLLFPLNIAMLFSKSNTIPPSIPGQLELMIQIIIWINVLITFYFIIWFSVEMLKKFLYIKSRKKEDTDEL